MFPLMTGSRPHKRSFRELVRGAMDSALEFATLGEATARPAPAPTSGHPHRRHVSGHRPGRRRPGMVAPRPQVCSTPVHRPARRTCPPAPAGDQLLWEELITPAGPRRGLHALGPPLTTAARAPWSQDRRPPRRKHRTTPAAAGRRTTTKSRLNGRLLSEGTGGDLLSQALAGQVPSALWGLTALFGM